MYKTSILFLPFTLGFSLMLVSTGYAAENLKLNPNLDYSSDSEDGPLITGDNMSDTTVDPGKPAYIMFTIHQCYNSKNQARRTVDLYKKYEGKVDFVLIDLDAKLSKEQKELKKRFYPGYVPHVTIIDGRENVVYNSRYGWWYRYRRKPYHS